ncbi:MAG: TetR/AcrR family transcriptional regulator [Oscillospiraceae bacterium]|nr:TetR/AcrR family transcriptional regulator [Oscillospiraceae bacterium]
MPKFNDTERAIIQEALLTKGEQLFIRYGLKKVTVDDLVNEAGIAKGSFYAFYKSKEHLYTEILFDIQNRVLADTAVFLEEHKSLPPKELVKKLTVWSFDGIEKYPILLQQDLELMTYLVRKLPKEILDTYPDLDVQMTKMLAEQGVKFKCGVEVAGSVSQTLSIVFAHLMGSKDKNAKAVMEIYIDGIVNEIVEE